MWPRFLHWQMKNCGLRGEHFVTHVMDLKQLGSCLFALWVIDLQLARSDGLFNFLPPPPPFYENMSTELTLKPPWLLVVFLGMALFRCQHSWGFTLSISPCLLFRNCQRWQNSLLKMNQSFSIRGIVSYNNHINPQTQWYWCVSV